MASNTGTPLQCSRCHQKNIYESNWEHTISSGRIVAVQSAQIFASLAGDANTATDVGFRLWQDGHPAIKRMSAQDVEFAWSGTSQDYRLCYECHKSFLKMIGKFFRVVGQPLDNGKGDKSEQELLEIIAVLKSDRLTMYKALHSMKGDTFSAKYAMEKLDEKFSALMGDKPLWDITKECKEETNHDKED